MECKRTWAQQKMPFLKTVRRKCAFWVRRQSFLEKEAKKDVRWWIAFLSECAYFVNLGPNSDVNYITMSYYVSSSFTDTVTSFNFPLTDCRILAALVAAHAQLWFIQIFQDFYLAVPPSFPTKLLVLCPECWRNIPIISYIWYQEWN